MIQLVSCGHNFVHSDGIRIDRSSGAGNYAFVLFRSKAEVVIDGTAYTVDNNAYILMQPSTPYMYRDLEKPFVNDWFHCEGTELGAYLHQLQLPLDRPAEAAYPASVSRGIMELQNVNWLGGPHRLEIIDLDLRSLLMKLANWRHLPPAQGNAGRYLHQLSEIRSELYRSPQASYSLDELAASVNLSKSYFQHLYKDLFGCSVSSDMINSRLEYAKYLLDNSSLSIGGIAKMCGYENETHFMRQFKKFVSATPSGYRKRK
ncbi:helix-turn-helix domain-containing protein [Paenibacillus sp. S28]|uniref:helix-turn-helix domain-containing protein n=1 Tax=Paenibacillus sp. S28 TaxID=2767463 RepID=UPI00190DA563|nr:AraC family transcriptional regulator [Paenibacillus sp. S28]MBJ9991005.1 helix-turn-helix transcriptional regulator [Paenibacillus sp. S28]